MPEFITDEEMAKLPSEPAEAFVQLERIVRRELERRLLHLEQGEQSDPYYRTYMSTIISAVEFYGISALSGWERIPINDEQWDAFQQFLADVAACTTTLRLHNTRRFTMDSVALDAKTKTKLTHLINQVREMVEKLDISVTKKDRLFARINAFQAEIDRQRTGPQSFGALMIEVCADLGESAKRAEPLIRAVERIGNALGIAKRAEEATQSRIPAPEEQKRIEGPEDTAQKSPFDQPLDDEIPF